MGMKCFKILLAKAYFDKGLSLTNYLKYAVAVLVVKIPVKQGIIAGIIYGIFCYIFGKVWYKFHLVETEAEINNIFNPFVKDVREKLGIETFK